MNTIISIEHLVKSYKELRAIDDISFDVNEGEILGLLGPNGSGKTTTINCLLSLLNVQSGTIQIFGKEMKPDSYDIKRKIGVVFQEVAVFDELTVYDNINYFCGLYIANKKERQQCVQEAIDLVGLNEFKKFLPRQLSGGLLRRLNIACGIAHKPALIILDEPTVAVDPQSRNHILEGIQTLRDRGATVIYTTHYMEEVELICDRVIILDRGKVIASGDLDALKSLANIEEKIIVETKMNNHDLTDIRAMEHVLQVEQIKGTVTITYGSGQNNLPHLMDHLKGKNIKYDRIYSQRPTLNDVFLELTGKELRD